MPDINCHIADYLDYYIKMKTPPEFAILLRGNWGSGKSWFINDFRGKKEKEGIKFIYVSLYGISTSKGIDDAIFEQMHPILSSKGMKLAGRIFKGLLKTSINVDLNKDGKSDGSVSSSVPDINLPDFMKDSDSRILIFDDLERCSMKTSDVLGYINQFVENKGLKVIILANEDELISQSKEEDGKHAKDATSPKQPYLLIKEKLVGKTFEVKPDFETAYDTFIDNLSGQKLKDCLKANKKVINNIYDEAGYQNLRHVKQSLLDFERFFKFIPEKSFSKPELIEHIIEFFFSLSFELKKGEIGFEDIKLVTSYSSFLNDGEQAKKTAIGKVRSKYSVFKLYYNPIKENLWYEFFKIGIVDSKKMEESILNSMYYQNENTPTWQKLWNFKDLNDDEFESLCTKAFEELKTLTISEKGIVMHLTTMLVYYSGLGIFKKDKDEILELGKKNIDSLKAKGQLTSIEESRFRYFESPFEEYSGLGYHGRDSQETKDFFLYVKESMVTSGKEQFPIEANKLIDIMKEDVTKFGERISITNSPENKYYDIPVLKHIEPKAFVKSFMELGMDEKKRVAYYLKQRYRHDEFRKHLISELPWLKEVTEKIRKKGKSLEGKLSGVMINGIILKTLDDTINTFEEQEGKS